MSNSIHKENEIVEKEKIDLMEDFNDIETRDQTNLKEPEDDLDFINFEIIGKIESISNRDNNDDLFENKTPMNNQIKFEGNNPISFINRTNLINDNLLNKKRNRDENNPKNKKEINLKKKWNLNETSIALFPNDDIKNDKNKLKLNNNVDQNQKNFSRRKPYIKRRLIFNKKKWKKKKNEKQY